jgi:hypothetical protein
MLGVFLGGKCRTYESSLQRKDSARKFDAQVPPWWNLAPAGPTSPINQSVIWFFLDLTAVAVPGENLAKFPSIDKNG